MTSAAPVLLADPTAGLHACLDELASHDFDGLTGVQQAELLRSFARAESRIAALRLGIIATADRSRTAESTGAANTGQWAAKIANADPAAAQRQVSLAQGLNRRAATQLALSTGSISSEHAAVIVQADRHLPPQINGAQRDEVEAALLGKAQNLSPSALRRVARRALEAVEVDPAVVDAHENDLVASQEDRERAKVRFTLYENGDGTVTGHFTVPSAQGQLLKKIIDTITAPRRGRLGATKAQVGEREARTDRDRARGEAFVELIEHLPTDHLHPRTAATLVITLSEEVLRDALRAVGLDTGGVLSAGEVRRLACTSRLIPAVLNRQSLPLDLGRSARLFTENQRVALAQVHKTCAADGCDRPFAWCELHHLHEWALGGRTDLANAIPLCHFHHQRIHDHRYRHARSNDGSIVFHRQL